MYTVTYTNISLQVICSTYPCFLRSSNLVPLYMTLFSTTTSVQSSGLRVKVCHILSTPEQATGLDNKRKKINVTLLDHLDILPQSSRLEMTLSATINGKKLSAKEVSGSAVAIHLVTSLQTVSFCLSQYMRYSLLNSQECRLLGYP